jgi:hypothetical protein
VVCRGAFLLSSSIILDKAPLVLGSDPVGIPHGSANGYRSVGKRDALRITSVPRILGHADLLGRRFKCERWQWRAALGHMGSPEKLITVCHQIVVECISENARCTGNSYFTDISGSR